MGHPFTPVGTPRAPIFHFKTAFHWRRKILIPTRGTSGAGWKCDISRSWVPGSYAFKVKTLLQKRATERYKKTWRWYWVLTLILLRFLSLLFQKREAFTSSRESNRSVPEGLRSTFSVVIPRFTLHSNETQMKLHNLDLNTVPRSPYSPDLSLFNDLLQSLNYLVKQRFRLSQIWNLT